MSRPVLILIERLSLPEMEWWGEDDMKSSSIHHFALPKQRVVCFFILGLVFENRSLKLLFVWQVVVLKWCFVVIKAFPSQEVSWSSLLGQVAHRHATGRGINLEAAQMLLHVILCQLLSTESQQTHLLFKFLDSEGCKMQQHCKKPLETLVILLNRPCS